jgi:hypothetical protein
VPLRDAQDGKPVRDAPTGFPIYVSKRQPRIVTADVWAYLTHASRELLPKTEAVQAAAFVDQAFEFFEAARNPRIGSRPLLFYYSFLNLAKVFLLVRRVPMAVAPLHGIRDPRENVKGKLYLEGQRVRLEAREAGQTKIFPEFVIALGGAVGKRRNVEVLSLFRQIPGIHRTFCRVSRRKASFLPVARFEVLSHEGRVFARMALRRNDADVRVTIAGVRSRQKFKRVFEQVRSEEGNEYWFETGEVAGATKARDQAIKQIAERIQNVGVWSIMTREGYRYYLGDVAPAGVLPPLASIYATMFYLGSVTRYKPYDFDRMVSRRYAWLISEFLRTQPSQFLYCLASHIAGIDVVPPFASLE